MDNINILYVEDELDMASIVSDSLRYIGYQVIHFANPKAAFESFSQNKPDIVILDVTMPVLDGFDLAVKIRELDHQIPIIFVTARTRLEDVIQGFEVGANDYIKKPFNVEELVLRIKALFRHKTNIWIYNLGLFSFNSRKHELSLNGIKTELSYRESELLKKLISCKNEILTRKTILEEFWDQSTFFTGRSLDVFISRLRNYLKADPDIEIISVRGVGYMLRIKQNDDQQLEMEN